MRRLQLHGCITVADGWFRACPQVLGRVGRMNERIAVANLQKKQETGKLAERMKEKRRYFG